MDKISAMILLVALIVLIPIIDAQSRGGGRGGGEMARRPVGERPVARPMQRTPAMSRAALYTGAAEMGAAAGSSNNSQPEYVPVEVAPTQQTQ
jgi:hypothetical protein